MRIATTMFRVSFVIAALLMLGCNANQRSSSTANIPDADPQVLAAAKEQCLLDKEPADAIAMSELWTRITGEVVTHDHDHADDAHADDTHADHDHDVHADHDHDVHDDHDHDAHDHDAHDDHDHDAHDDAERVAFVARIAPMEQTAEAPDAPWSRGQAMFYVVDPEALHHSHDGHEHVGEEHECKFCAGGKTVLGLVQFRGGDGQVFPVDARQLFDLKGDEHVVIFGSAERKGDALLMVNAEAMYVRR